MKPKHDMPPIEVLRELLRYDAETGSLTWIGPKSANNQRKPGDPQGTPEKTGYLHIRLGEGYFGKRNIYSHRVAWALHHGVWPTRFIDHINGDKTDNRISNLREATKRQNKYNSKVRADSTVGLKGVCRRPNCRTKPFVAQIVVNGQKHALGFFETAAAAHEAYREAAHKLHGPFARTE